MREVRGRIQYKKLALLLAGAASLPNLFDSTKLQYQLVIDFFQLENIGMVLVRGVKGAAAEMDVQLLK